MVNVKLNDRTPLVIVSGDVETPFVIVTYSDKSVGRSYEIIRISQVRYFCENQTQLQFANNLPSARTYIPVELAYA